MTRIRFMAVVSLGVLLCAPALFAQTPFRYREYALGANIASVVRASNTRDDGVKTLHERPALIQELEWRAPYVPTGAQRPDPVRDVRFSFYDDQLYQVVVTYDQERIEGLTNDDLIEGLSATYGVPLLRNARAARSDSPADLREITDVAQWEDDASLLTLTRGTHSAQFQLVLVSKSLNPRARAAVKEALRLDAQEAPQRERDQRTREATDAKSASQKARVANKAAFKP